MKQKKKGKQNNENKGQRKRGVERNISGSFDLKKKYLRKDFLRAMFKAHPDSVTTSHHIF